MRLSHPYPLEVVALAVVVALDVHRVDAVGHLGDLDQGQLAGRGGAARAETTRLECPAAGFDDRGILQITLIASWFNYVDRVADALGVGRDQPPAP